MAELPVNSFKFRLSSRSPDDRLLAEYMALDLETREVNLSQVIKRLLLAWYQQRYDTGIIALPSVALGAPVESIPQDDDREDPDDPLVKAMLGLDFEASLR